MAKRKSSKTAPTPISAPAAPPETSEVLEAAADAPAAPEPAPIEIVAEAPSLATPEAPVPTPAEALVAEAAAPEAALPETSPPAIDAPLPSETVAVGPAEPEAEAAAVIAIAPAKSKSEQRAAQRSLFLPSLFSARAASVALAAALGALAGALVSAGIASAPSAAVATAPGPDPVLALRTSVSQLATEIAALKATVGTAGAESGKALARLEERLDDAETLQGAIADRVAKLADGTVKPIATTSREITGSITPPAPAATTARGWVLWRVANGRALVQGNGGYYEVMAGSTLPGLGTVQKIARGEQGRWMVLTQKGVILPPEG